MNSSLANVSTTLNISSQPKVSKFMDKTFLTSDPSSQMRDVLSISLKEQQQNFKNEVSMIQGAKDAISSSIYMSNLQKERADQYDIVLAQRKYIWKQEEQLYDQIDELKKTNNRYQNSVQHYGIKNQNLESEVKNKFNKVQDSLYSLQEQKQQVLKNFDQIQQSLVNSKSKLSNNGQLIVQGNNQYDQLADFIRQQEKKVNTMKSDFNDPSSNQIIPFDKNLQQMAENTFEKQARFLYQGTKFEGNDDQKIQALSTLRKKIEQHVQHRGLQGVVLDMPFKLNMNKEQESEHKVEYNQTLAQIDQVRQEYIQSGGTDPNYLISINNLERYYKDNHPIGKQQMPSKLIMNTETRGEITKNPIFEYLPPTFQQEILQLENQVNIQREADLRNPQLNLELLRAPKEVGDSSKADEAMLENLRQQESELLLVMNKNNTIHKQKFQEIQELKQIYEKRFLEKKVQEQLALKQIEEEVLNFKGLPQDRINYLQYLQGQIGTMPLFYDPDSGIALRIDFINKLPLCYDYVKLSYGIFIKNDEEPKTTQTTNNHECTQDNIFSKKAIMQERFIERNHIIYKETYLYLVLWGYSSDFGSGQVPLQIGWTIHKLFDEQNLLSGCFLMPLYNSEFTFDLQRQPEVQDIKVGIRISMPGDAVLDLQNKIMNVLDYKLQPIHIKQNEVIEQERKFKFKENRIIKIPKEFIQTQFNDPKLWQSELPPNVYKLLDYDFLNEEQVAKKQAEQEFEERQQNRMNRMRRRQIGRTGTIRAPTDKKKTMLTFRQRLALKKSGATTPNTNKNKEPTSGPASSKGTSKVGSSKNITSSRNIARPQEKEKSQIAPTKPRMLTFKLRSISQVYVQGIDNLTLKLALFSGIKLLEDDQKQMCVYTKDLEPDEKGDNYFNFTENYTFQMNLNEFFEDEEPEDILNTYLFIAIFKDTTTLFGWKALQVFDNSEDTFKVQSGIYYENLYGPPGQAPPFNLSKTKILNAQINFIIMNDDDRVLQLETFDNYKHDQKLQNEEEREKRKKIYQVSNSKWNTQIKIDLSKLKNFTEKQDFDMQTRVTYDDNVVIDVLDRLCVRIDQIDLFEGTGKGEYIANYTMILRIGTRYLIDTFPTEYKKMTYFFQFYSKSKIVGACTLPMFVTNQTAKLHLGSQKLMVHDLNESGKLGKKTTKEIYIFIQEEPLNLKDVEETPKYAQQSKEQKTMNKQDQSKFLIIEMEQLSDYVSSDPLDFTIQLYDGAEPAMDSDGVICAYTSNQQFSPSPNNTVQINEIVYFKLPINAMIEKKQGLENYQVFISFPDLGWINFQLFLNGELNQSDFVAKLFRGDVPAPPVDYTNMKKINTKLSYQVRYDVKEEEEIVNEISSNNLTSKSGTQKIPSLAASEQSRITSRRQVNQEISQDKLSITLINVNGFGSDITKLSVKGIMLIDGNALHDKNNQPCSFKTSVISNNNKVAYLNNQKYVFEIDLKSLGQQTYLFLSVLDEKEVVLGWFGKTIMNSNGKLNKGQSFEYLYQPPPIKPPLDIKKLKTLQQSIQFELK